MNSVYISVNSTSPAQLFGGTWEQIEDTFLLAAGTTYTAGSTGGSATQTLTINQMPAHYHSQSGGTTAGDGDIIQRGFSSGLGPVANMETVGGGQPFDIMPPYLAVYVWKRIS